MRYAAPQLSVRQGTPPRRTSCQSREKFGGCNMAMRRWLRAAGIILLLILIGFSRPSTAATIAADASQIGPAMSADQLGVNLNAVFTEAGDASYLPLMASAGIGLIRWPEGGVSDFYHWKTHDASVCATFSHTFPSSTAFDTCMQNIAQPLRAHAAITVNYGTNPDCSGRADPTEAAGGVNYAA